MFAYQLLKIEFKGRKADRVEYDELRHKATYLGKDDEEDTDEEEEEDVEELSISPANAGNTSSGQARAK